MCRRAPCRNSSAGSAGGIGQHDQELAAARGAEQDTGKAEFIQERARQGLGKQGDPLRAPGE